MSSLSIARIQRNAVSVSITNLAERLENLETEAERKQMEGLEANLHLAGSHRHLKELILLVFL